MLRIFVVSQNGAPPAGPLTAVFGEGIGSIGRDETNALALPDPHKHISRVQAQVKCLSGEYFLVDQGGNPTSVNGRFLGKGNVASLHEGDRIEMAEWLLQVEAVRPGSVPFPAMAAVVSVPLQEPEEFDFDVPTQAGQDSVESVEPSRAAPVAVVQPTTLVTPVNTHSVVRVSVEGPAERLSTATPLEDGNNAELLAAFLRGLGVPALNPAGGLTPALAEHIGVMLRESVQGTAELLATRAASKRELRAEATMIVSKNNNPLKFSPDVNFALHQLLQPQRGKGFMSPVEALHDAYDDLQAHQIGIVAGMHGALTGILGRFRPSELEARLSDKNFLDSVLPANRKAKLWDLYEQRYADIQREAEDDFHSLFGHEFLRAYEEQIDRLTNDRAP